MYMRNHLRTAPPFTERKKIAEHRHLYILALSYKKDSEVRHGNLTPVKRAIPNETAMT